MFKYVPRIAHKSEYNTSYSSEKFYPHVDADEI